MTITRRTFLAAGPASLVVGPALATNPPSVFAAYERDTGGRIGVYASNVATGATITWRPDERIVMCSTFKASLVACVLARVDRGEDHLQDRVAFGEADLLDYAPVARQHLHQGSMSVGEMAQGAVELSDNTCANLLLARIGGPAALTAFWRATGDGVSRLDHNEPVLNRSPPGDPHDTTTPAAMAGTLRRIALGSTLSPASRDLIIGWMVACRTGLHRLRAGMPTGWRIGDKTGNNGADASSDIAVAWPAPNRPLVICVYTQGGSPTQARLETVFADIGRMVATRLA